jgi:hypothetical protein
MAMPLRLIYNVQISLKQKLGLVCVFGLGFVMIAFSIVRAKQVLVEQAFVNLTLLMAWSTLAGTICKSPSRHSYIPWEECIADCHVKLSSSAPSRP